ncbi:efflux RND transporter periplasmic adaptor subunit [Parapedobacter koreensis]|uniref:Membrane fusion protein, cobalt-zinc-cadmium efflux system n=1 Tax=Parapedobacter koreensis TaxID=332977 RepID=A0A1H7T9D3_9SPHI|nr:efflux RND transporter periplasmic adaptor subunit [Parapedobacter koreensis]SEL81318.1 membrane fusion protein, cobalt-zinc-cadmium efflux system [Parapedobacter koreensis]
MIHTIKSYSWIMLLLAVACDQREQLVDEQSEGFCLSENLRHQLVLDTLRERDITQHITLTGEVSYNPDKVVQFVSWIAGIAVQTHFSLGDFVRQGQVLATLKSPALNTMLAEQRSLQAQRQLAERQYTAAQGMYDDNIAAERDLIETKSALEKLDAELANIEANLALFHPNPAQGIFEIRSPSSGYIVEKNINPGMPINDGDNLFTVSGLSEVWVMANVYATDMQFVQQGMDVEIRTLAYPGAVFHGRISALPQVFDSHERVLKARIVIPNEGLELKPGMSADIAVERRGAGKAVALPADAVIFDDNQYFAVVYGGDCDLQLRRISFVARDDQWYFVDNGLEPGERVVSQNHLLIYERIKG